MKTTAQKLTKPTIRVGQLRQWLPITFILLLATGLDLYQLGTESLWLDEILSIQDAKELVLPGVRPLYYILLRVWMVFGTSDAWLRGLGVLFGLGSIFLTYQLGRRVVGESTGLIAALLLTLSALFINNSQEVRMYTLSTCLGLGGTLALTHALEQPTASSRRWWAGMRLLSLLAVPLNVILLLSDVILVLVRFRKQRRILLAFGKLLLLISILWLPSALALASATPDFMSGWVTALPHPRAYDVVYMLTRFTGWDFGQLDAIALFDKWLFNDYFFKTYAFILLSLLTVALLNKRYPKLRWIATWALLPSATLFLISTFSSTLWINRYLLFVCPYFFILLAAGFRQIWCWQRTVAIVVALIYLVAVGGGLLNYYTYPNREDWRGVAQTISLQDQPGDAIGVLFSTRYNLAIEHYYHGDAPIYNVENKFTPLELKSGDKAIVEISLDRLPPIKSRLWLVYRRAINNSINVQQNQLIQATVGEKFQIRKHWELDNFDLFLVTKKR